MLMGARRSARSGRCRVAFKQAGDASIQAEHEKEMGYSATQMAGQGKEIVYTVDETWTSSSAEQESLSTLRQPQ